MRAGLSPDITPQESLMRFVKLKLSKIFEILFFLLVMALTFYTVFSRNDLLKIFSSMQHLNPFYFICAIFSAVFFVCMEGFMIWYLLKLTEKKFPCSVAFRILLSVFSFPALRHPLLAGSPPSCLP